MDLPHSCFRQEENWVRARAGLDPMPAQGRVWSGINADILRENI